AALSALKRNERLPITTRILLPEAGSLLTGPWLVGIECGSFPFYNPVVHKGTKKKVEDYQVKSHSGVAAVVPAWKLQELLDGEEFDMARKEEDEKLTKRKQSGRFDRETAVGEDDLPALTRQGFGDVLRQVSRKTTDPSEPKSEKKS